MDGHKARKLFDHNQRGEFGDNCTIMMPRDRIDKIPTPVAAERHMVTVNTVDADHVKR